MIFSPNRICCDFALLSHCRLPLAATLPGSDLSQPSSNATSSMWTYRVQKNKKFDVCPLGNLVYSTFAILM